MLLVGNKCDLTSQKVASYEIEKAFVDEIVIPFHETSAKSSTNVEEAFMAMTVEIKNRMASQPSMNNARPLTFQIRKRGVNKKVLIVPLIENKGGISGIMEGRSLKVLCLLPTGTEKHCFQQRPHI
ncbi:unnamed protein product [Lactuca saligna]|uniref:Uncharacterized protein n=1 Tax=Lactuca saligna TaxID=75948 RepID=A0AA35Y9E6_LACSI|nr:unnamed protein product [Lactuca saligna]